MPEVTQYASRRPSGDHTGPCSDASAVAVSRRGVDDRVGSTSQISPSASKAIAPLPGVAGRVSICDPMTRSAPIRAVITRIQAVDHPTDPRRRPRTTSPPGARTRVRSRRPVTTAGHGRSRSVVAARAIAGLDDPVGDILRTLSREPVPEGSLEVEARLHAVARHAGRPPRSHPSSLPSTVPDRGAGQSAPNSDRMSAIARWRRDPTVPYGMPRTSATSLLGRST